MGRLDRQKPLGGAQAGGVGIGLGKGLEQPAQVFEGVRGKHSAAVESALLLHFGDAGQGGPPIQGFEIGCRALQQGQLVSRQQLAPLAGAEVLQGPAVVVLRLGGRPFAADVGGAMR